MCLLICCTPTRVSLGFTSSYQYHTTALVLYVTNSSGLGLKCSKIESRTVDFTKQLASVASDLSEAFRCHFLLSTPLY